MITLERLLELRKDSALMKHMLKIAEHAGALVAIDLKETAAGISNPSCFARAQALEDLKQVAQAMMLTVYEEARRPYVELLRDIDKSAVVRARPTLHSRLKELIK